ncbi:hypothetical protein EUTSA_v10000829mg [Eutrema salsugineum]|uniref:Zinc finger PHD-type domain-containing protein n=1 Tax=Eutrema salsugineum TaxID=72664 RepID=V4L832_EUTSA|nr:uncharacterized protein LOC18016143 [Eutrema salsugineum]ESQ39819.1 hypothetical protein EUTSA_v10000829mg [Eutrema salsugineum]
MNAKKHLNLTCRLSHPAYPHTLSPRTSKETPKSVCFVCSRDILKWGDDLYYSCTTCDVEFHKDCYSEPKKLTHPYHLQHPLDLIDSKNHEADQTYKCTWCGSNHTRWYYHCSICSFCLDASCSYKYPSLTITNPQSHHHPLSFFPRPLLVPCDACGLINQSDPSYACFQCSYIVHESCINLPRVIKITRHQHRLSHTPYLSPTIRSSCRVCHKNVDNKYGQYSCNHETCSYVAHSKCATHKEVWDGRELEWEPEEPEDPENTAPFKKIGVDLIKHICHEHALRLNKYYKNVGDAQDKLCQACVLPIDSRDFYDCIECDFSLHEVCASLPRELDHALHKHRLVLDTSPQNDYDDMSCSVCLQRFSGFRYKCKDKGCLISDIYRIHVGCITLPDVFTHKSHEHPLCFPILEHRYKEKIICKICKKHCLLSFLQCTTCEFDMCYRCATFPNEVHYKHDEHPLSLCYGETADGGKYWCDICEKELDSTKWFYTCNKCCVTVHLHCIFGSSIYMKPGFTFAYITFKVKVLRNNSITRPICDGCEQRCPTHVYYEVYFYRYKLVSCSLECLEQRINGLDQRVLRRMKVVVVT